MGIAVFNGLLGVIAGSGQASSVVVIAAVRSPKAADGDPVSDAGSFCPAGARKEVVGGRATALSLLVVAI